MTSSSFSPTEQAFLDNPQQFSNRKQRYLRYRVRKKLNVAAQPQQRRGYDLVAQPGRERRMSFENIEYDETDKKKALGGIWTHDLRSSPPVFIQQTRAEDYETFALPG